jgi:hypothetical protein
MPPLNTENTQKRGPSVGYDSGGKGMTEITFEVPVGGRKKGESCFVDDNLASHYIVNKIAKRKSAKKEEKPKPVEDRAMRPTRGSTRR